MKKSNNLVRKGLKGLKGLRRIQKMVLIVWQGLKLETERVQKGKEKTKRKKIGGETESPKQTPTLCEKRNETMCV